MLFVEAARCLGFGARIVSGYLFNPDRSLTGSTDAGSTHAWGEVFVSGAGWISFDPTNRSVGGANLIPVAVARDIRQAMPVSGSYVGNSDAFKGMTVEVQVTPNAAPAWESRPRSDSEPRWGDAGGGSSPNLTQRADAIGASVRLLSTRNLADEMTHAALIPLLGREFDDFLFASIGEDRNGTTLSVLSALARLDVDPWQETASLARMPKEKGDGAAGCADRRRAVGTWRTALPAATIAARLIALLPQVPNDRVARPRSWSKSPL